MSYSSHNGTFCTVNERFVHPQRILRQTWRHEDHTRMLGRRGKSHSYLYRLIAASIALAIKVIREWLGNKVSKFTSLSSSLNERMIE